MTYERGGGNGPVAQRLFAVRFLQLSVSDDGLRRLQNRRATSRCATETCRSALLQFHEAGGALSHFLLAIAPGCDNSNLSTSALDDGFCTCPRPSRVWNFRDLDSVQAKILDQSLSAHSRQIEVDSKPGPFQTKVRHPQIHTLGHPRRCRPSKMSCFFRRRGRADGLVRRFI
jgi:hypothetical protein